MRTTSPALRLGLAAQAPFHRRSAVLDEPGDDDLLAAADFAGAADAILRCRTLDDGFGLNSLYDLYAARIRVFEQNPPPPDWNGVVVLESK